MARKVVDERPIRADHIPVDPRAEFKCEIARLHVKMRSHEEAIRTILSEVRGLKWGLTLLDEQESRDPLDDEDLRMDTDEML
jgi:hypothetical protein|tara:strand:- start:884 stop:1129 length:246 start_codon:yes stop_codon:yes gene_type:complete